MANKQLPEFITAENNLDGQEPVYIAQGGKTRKTLLSKIKDFIIGTTALTTTDKTVTGSIEEINKKATDNAAQLKDNMQNITDLQTNKVDKSKVVNNCSVTEAGFIADARQLKYLNDKFSNYLTRKENINIDTERGSWYYNAIDAHNSEHNTYPFDNFGGVILQIEAGYFRFQIAVSGWGTVGAFIRSINAGLEFSNATGTDNANWKKINFTV
nr:hypothetical protein [Clostridium neonatale]